MNLSKYEWGGYHYDDSYRNGDNVYWQQDFFVNGTIIKNETPTPTQQKQFTFLARAEKGGSGVTREGDQLVLHTQRAGSSHDINHSGNKDVATASNGEVYISTMELNCYNTSWTFYIYSETKIIFYVAINITSAAFE